MLIVYRILINLIFILSPIILIVRLLKKKEDIKRFKEKFCFFSKRRRSGKIVWFHGASVGELQSVVPIFEILEKNKKEILISPYTLTEVINAIYMLVELQFILILILKVAYR